MSELFDELDKLEQPAIPEKAKRAKESVYVMKQDTIKKLIESKGGEFRISVEDFMRLCYKGSKTPHPSTLGVTMRKMCPDLTIEVLGDSVIRFTLKG